MNRPATPLLETSAVRLGEAFDLLAAYAPPVGAFFERRGVGVAGAGGYPTLTFGAADPSGLTHVVDLLRTSVSTRHDVAPVAVGAIAFRGGERRLHQLMVLRRAVRRDADGRTWRLDTQHVGLDADEPPPFEPVEALSPHEPFSDVQLREVPPAQAYADGVAEAVERIARSELRKVVLARTIEVRAGRTFDPRLLVHRLRAVDPDAYTFAAPTDDGVIVGASPELLISRHGSEIRSNPLAGSAPRAGDPEEDRANAEALLASN